MTFILSAVFTVALCLFTLSASESIVPCTLEDEECVTTSFQLQYPLFVRGDPDKGIPSADPMRKDAVSVTTPKLSYSFTNGKLSGFADCCVNYARFSPGNTQFEFKMNCPRLIMKADYVLSGQIVGFPVNGVAKGVITFENCDLTLINDVIQRTDEKNNNYINLQNLKYEKDILGRITFDFKNLFGDEKRTEQLLKVANDNWRIVAEEIQIDARVKENLVMLTEQLNRNFEKTPTNEIFYQIN